MTSATNVTLRQRQPLPSKADHFYRFHRSYNDISVNYEDNKATLAEARKVAEALLAPGEEIKENVKTHNEPYAFRFTAGRKEGVPARAKFPSKADHFYNFHRHLDDISVNYSDDKATVDEARKVAEALLEYGEVIMENVKTHNEPYAFRFTAGPVESAPAALSGDQSSFES